MKFLILFSTFITTGKNILILVSRSRLTNLMRTFWTGLDFVLTFYFTILVLTEIPFSGVVFSGSKLAGFFGSLPSLWGLTLISWVKQILLLFVTWDCRLRTLSIFFWYSTLKLNSYYISKWFLRKLSNSFIHPENSLFWSRLPVHSEASKLWDVEKCKVHATAKAFKMVTR